MTKQLTVAVVGATGAVGSKMMEQLIKRKFPIGHIKFLASARSAGKSIEFNGKHIQLKKRHLRLLKASMSLYSQLVVQYQLCLQAAKRGAVVIDNTSHFSYGSRGTACRA